MKNIFCSLAVLILAVGLSFADEKPFNYKPKDGYVPDEQTAIAIAVAVWSPIYGRDHIQNEKPFKAVLTNGVWHVEGTLPEGLVGGVAVAEISKDDGRILKVSHGQ
jgi:hypothetical protein